MKKPTTLKNDISIREWATSLTIGAFILSAATGILLFFKVRLGLVKPVHEWLSWLLVIGTMLHVYVNWSASVRYFARPVARVILLVSLVLLGASLLPVQGGHKGHPFAKISTTLTQSPLWAVAQAANHKPDEAVAMLKEKGLQIEGKNQTIQEIAIMNHRPPMDVLTVIF